MSYRVIKNAETGDIILRKAKWCASFWCHLKGLQFVRNLPEDEGLLFVTGKETRSQATIHMFFMFFSIGVVWLDSQGKVVDKKLAKPWRPAYAPSLPAQYYIEARPSVLDKVQIGDILQFDEVK
ncbi:MAG: hypothetical protein D6711_17705 [Chloroflexi bacterium]|nr:MAG: hypothetical protein D6711_17705 [Chloroflexota bacterium]